MLVPGSGYHQFAFRVKFYSSDPAANLKEELTRYQLFLQLKRDVLGGSLPAPYQEAVRMAALALQCESTKCRVTLCTCMKDN